MSKKILILGSTGMLGHQVIKYFLLFEEYEVIDISYKTKLRDETILLDVRKQSLVEQTIINIKPDFIVNCIGILISGANKSPSDAIYVNSYLPHQLANISKVIDAKLIHISTDCVFSGLKGQYIEIDETDGKDIYAKTKILGEVIDSHNLTLRTSLIGKELKNNGEGIFSWFMKQNGTISGFKKAIWSGVTAQELAKAIKWSIEYDITGLYHLTNNQSINKYELLSLFKKYTNKDIKIIKIDGKKIDKSFIDTRKEINYNISSYENMIKDMIDDSYEKEI